MLMSARNKTPNCPCCGRKMPKTDFMLYPKSAAVIRDGYVLLFGLVQFRIIQRLYQSCPDPVALEVLVDYVYNHTKNYAANSKNISATVVEMRRKLKLLRVSIVTQHRSGYSLRIEL